MRKNRETTKHRWTSRLVGGLLTGVLLVALATPAQALVAPVLSGVVLSDTSTRLNWTDAGDEQKYLLYRNGGLIFTDWSDNHVYTDTGLTPNTTYSYRVDAKKGNTTVQSNTIQLTTTGGPPPSPECSDAVNNDPAEDLLVDFPADPGCTSATDNTELGNPPPPGETAGIRGFAGTRASTDIPGFPQSGIVIAPGATTIQVAVNMAGTSRVFLLQPGTYNITSTITPHTGDQFWAEDGVTITGTITSAFTSSSGVSNVKIMNVVFSGFSQQVFTSQSGWELGYDEFLNTGFGFNAGGSTGFTVHHSIFNQIQGAIAGFRARDITISDNQFGPVIGANTSGGGQKLVAVIGAVFAHNHCDGNVRGCIWFDTSNSEVLVEWNLIENTGTASPVGAISMEQNCWIDLTATGPDQATPMSDATKNVVRFNVLRNNFSSSIQLLNTCWTEVYGNTLENNLRGAATFSDIYLFFNNPVVNLQGFAFHVETANNWIHDNDLTLTDSTRKAAALRVQNVDTTPYWTNAKNNDFDLNHYDLASVSHVAFEWNGNKTFAQWQAVPQDVNGSVT